MLRQRGHRVSFAADPAAHLEVAYAVPGLRQVLRGNRARLWQTARANLDLTWRSPEIIADAAGWLAETGADAVVADHEPFVARAAAQAGVPVVALSHQLILTETLPRVPLRHAASWLGTSLGIGVLAPRRPDAAVVPSFFFPLLRPGSRATLVPPILRDDVLAARVSDGDRVLVYVNEGAGMAPLLDALAGVPADVYGLDPDTPAPAGVRLRAPSRAEFLADLAAARAVVSTAGFTLLSEALHLGKPVLALPNQGFFRADRQRARARGAGPRRGRARPQSPSGGCRRLPRPRRRLPPAAGRRRDGRPRAGRRRGGGRPGRGAGTRLTGSVSTGGGRRIEVRQERFTPTTTGAGARREVRGTDGAAPSHSPYPFTGFCGERGGRPVILNGSPLRTL